MNRTNRALPAGFPEKSRWVLFALLVPLLAFALWEAAKYDDKPIMQLALSRNGQQLYVFRGEFNNRTFPNQEVYEEVEILDLTSLQVIGKKKTRPEPIFPSSTGECFFQLTKDRKVRILEPGSFETRAEFTLPTIQGEQILTLEGDRRLLIVESLARTLPRQYLTIIDLTGNQPRIVRSEADAASILSKNGRRLLVSHHDTTTNAWTTESLVVEGGKLIPKGDSFLEFPLAASDDGNLVIVGVGGTRAFRNLQNGAIIPWALSLGAPVGASLTADGRLLRVVDTNGAMSVFDTSTGDLIHIVQLEQSDPMQWFRSFGVTFSISGDRVIAVIDRTLWIWDAASGKRMARYPDHRFARGTLGAMYVVWCVLWIGVGTMIRRARPWLDVLLIHVPLIVIIVHAATRPVSSIHRALIATSIGLLTSLLGMLIVWWIHGRVRWSLRLTGMVAGGAAVAGLLLASGHGNDMGVWNVMMGSGSFVVGLALLLKSLRWMGVGIRHVSDGSRSEDLRWQMPLKDILLMTTAIALLFTVARFADPSSRPLKIVLYLTLHGFLLSATVFICTIVAFLPKRFALAFPFVSISAAIFGATTTWTFGRTSIDPLWWCEVLYAVTSGAFFCSMVVFRLHGYRLVRLYRDQKDERDNKDCKDVALNSELSNTI